MLLHCSTAVRRVFLEPILNRAIVDVTLLSKKFPPAIARRAHRESIASDLQGIHTTNLSCRDLRGSLINYATPVITNKYGPLSLSVEVRMLFFYLNTNQHWQYRKV